MTELRTVAEFDALTRGIAWADAYIREYYYMSLPWSDGSNIRLLITLPYGKDVAGIEFMVREVRGARLGYFGELELSCHMDNWYKTIYFNSQKDTWICGAKIEYTLFDDAISEVRPRYGAYPASPNAIKAERLVDGWRLCSKCSEAWQESLDRTYSVCPRCFELTELTELSEGTE